jgi:hypothetical protein
MAGEGEMSPWLDGEKANGGAGNGIVHIVALASAARITCSHGEGILLREIAS